MPDTYNVECVVCGGGVTVVWRRPGEMDVGWEVCGWRECGTQRTTVAAWVECVCVLVNDVPHIYI